MIHHEEYTVSTNQVITLGMKIRICGNWEVVQKIELRTITFESGKQRSVTAVKHAIAEMFPHTQMPPEVHVQEETNSGGSCSYYRVPVPKELSVLGNAYIAECNDIIEALKMTSAEANAFKAVWRKAAARMPSITAKAGYDNGLRDAQKVEFFGGRLVKIAEYEAANDK